MVTARYFDYAAASPLDPDVLAAMQPYFEESFYNPSANYQAARSVHASIEAARSSVAQCLGARPSEIIFTAGGTEANNIAIHGIMRQYPDGNIVTSSIEHSAAMGPAAQYSHRQVLVTEAGSIALDHLRELIDNNTILISIMYANNEIGTVQPIREVSRIAGEIRRARKQAGNTTPLYIHTDACQAPNYLDIHVARLGVDIMTLNGGKIYGPKQSGILYVRGGLVLQPMLQGGGQERGLRSGTENVAGIIGFAAALKKTQAMRNTEAKRLQSLQAQFIKMLTKTIPEAKINGSLSRRLPNNVHVTLPGSDNERLLIALDQFGILAAAGSACSASSEEASVVLGAIGLDEASARASLRFSMGRGTTEDDIQAVVTALKNVYSASRTTN